MRKAEIYQQGTLAGILEELDQNHYRFVYVAGYRDQPISLALPAREAPYEFDKFPPVFEHWSVCSCSFTPSRWVHLKNLGLPSAKSSGRLLSTAMSRFGLPVTSIDQLVACLHQSLAFRVSELVHCWSMGLYDQCALALLLAVRLAAFHKDRMPLIG